MNITLGMATANDFQGCHQTIMSAKAIHDLSEVELLVVDTTPESEDGESVRHLCLMTGAKYIEYDGVQGTSAPRNAVFDYASSDLVLCVDSHVILQKGALDGFRRAAQEYGEDTLFSGPILFDNGNTSTHFDFSIWRDRMWGVWASAWLCPCGQWHSASQVGDLMVFREMKVDGEMVSKCQGCGRETPRTSWRDHAKALSSQGYRLSCEIDKPFEIPGNGLGCFGAWKDGWKRFSSETRGFGGEEGYIHLKYELAGGQNICVPDMRWNHRFGNPGKKSPPPTTFDRIRNYVVEFDEIGRSKTTMCKHFVDTGIASMTVNAISNDPDNVTPVSCGMYADPRTKGMLPPEGINSQQLYDWMMDVSKVSKENYDIIRQVASRCSIATEFSEYRETTVCLASAVKGHVVSYLGMQDLLTNTRIPEIMQEEGSTIQNHLLKHAESAFVHPSNELTVIATYKDINHLRMLMEKAKDSKYIIVSNILTAMRDKQQDLTVWNVVRTFLSNNEKWYTMTTNAKAGGIIVLSQSDGEWPYTPIRTGMPTAGPGTSLKSFLSRLGFKAGEGCGCNAKAQEMDIRGAKWCTDNIEEILDHLKQQANERKLPFIRRVAKKVVELAIYYGQRAVEKEHKEYRKNREKLNGPQKEDRLSLPDFFSQAEPDKKHN